MPALSIAQVLPHRQQTALDTADSRKSKRKKEKLRKSNLVFFFSVLKRATAKWVKREKVALEPPSHCFPLPRKTNWAFATFSLLVFVVFTFFFSPTLYKLKDHVEIRSRGIELG